MIGYIRDPKTWNAVQMVTVTSYELPLETAQGETGKVTIAGSLDSDYTRYIISIDGFDYVFKITGQSTGSENQTTITIEDLVSIMEHFTAMRSGDDSGNYNGELDAFYTYTRFDGLPRPVAVNSRYTPDFIYIDPQNIDAVSGALSDRNIPRSEYVTKINDYLSYIDSDALLRSIRQRGIQVTLQRKNVHVPTTSGDIQDLTDYDAIVATLADVGNDVLVVYFEDGHNQLISESYNDSICSCVRAYSDVSGAYSEYFLLEDGTISDDWSALTGNQAKGYTTITVYKSSEMSAYDCAVEIFAQNEHSHKIEFASDRVMHIGQPVKLILKRGILDSVISKVTAKSGDTRYHYTCGELPVTASERITSDKWEYSRRLPLNPRKGQLCIVEE